ncbi:MAG: type IV toxin-antitoxin system AbiEi family antitoxin domain-containing protein [Candidatus Eremiobacteraeota bacterium]|nr:type IV toxin-antitoxin system AbiEi family antitoxin domain-containing protein [Candidatus Eremiobacteraeota bacterium]
MATTLETLALVAEDHHGVIPAAAARAAGVSAATLVKLAARGRLERVARGVYRLPTFPHSLARHAQLHEALAFLTAGQGPRAAISHESALEVWGLSDASSAQVHVTIPATVRLRRDVPRWIKLHKAPLPERDIDESHGLRLTSVERTISDVLQSGRHDLALRAANDAVRSGALTKRRSRNLMREVRP